MDVGGGLTVTDEATGLTVDLRVRTLLGHEAEGFLERGAALSVSCNPTPRTPLGWTARAVPSWGAQATSSAEALWGRRTMAEDGGCRLRSRQPPRCGCALRAAGRRPLRRVPRVGFGTAEYGREYRLGYSLEVLRKDALEFELGVDAQRQGSPLTGGADHGVVGRATVGW